MDRVEQLRQKSDQEIIELRKYCLSYVCEDEAAICDEMERRGLSLSTPPVEQTVKQVTRAC